MRSVIPVQMAVGNLFSGLFVLLFFFGPILLYIWLRAKGILGDPPGRGFR